MEENSNQSNTANQIILDQVIPSLLGLATLILAATSISMLTRPNYSTVSQHPDADANYAALKRNAKDIADKNKSLNTLGTEILTLKKSFYGLKDNYYIEQSPEIAEKSRTYNELEQRIVGDTYHFMRSVYMNPTLSEKSAAELGNMVLSDDFNQKWGKYHYLKPFQFFDTKVKYLDECRQQSINPANISPDDDFKAMSYCLDAKRETDPNKLAASILLITCIAIGGFLINSTSNARKSKKQEKAAKAPAI